MQYTGYSLAQAVSLDAIVAGLTGATGVEGVILSNQADFNTKNTATGVKNTAQDNTLSALETKATTLEAGATGLEGRNTDLDAALVVVQSREDALLAGLTGAAGLEARAVGFNTNITAINANLGGNIQEQINTKVADSIFQSLKTEFETDFAAFQAELNQKVVTATQEVLDARQDSDDAVLEKKFCSIEEFAQTFLQTYTVLKPDGNPYNFNGKIQKVDKAPPIFSITEKAQSGTNWDLKVKLTDYGYNVMSGNLIVKNGAGAVVNTLTKADFDATTKLYTLTLANSNSTGSLVGGPYTFEYQASTSTAVYSLALDTIVLGSISSSGGTGSGSGSIPPPVFGTAWVQMGATLNISSNSSNTNSSSPSPISMSNDGSTIAIGVINSITIDEDNGYYTYRNYIRIYKWNGSSWVQKGNDIIGEVIENDSGFSLSLNEDGSVIAISEFFGTADDKYTNGYVKVYEYKETSIGSGVFSWDQKGSQIAGEAIYDRSGWSVSLSSDGTVLAIGAPFNNGNSNDPLFVGHVRVYKWKETSIGSGVFYWDQRGSDIDGENNSGLYEGDMSGISISLSSDGTVLAIGAPFNDIGGSNSGYVRVYEWKETSIGSGVLSWVQKGANIIGESTGDRSGISVSLSSDGTVLAIGAPYNKGNSINSNPGHVRVYEWKENVSGSGTFTWVQRGTDIDGDNFYNSSGFSISLNGDGTLLAIATNYQNSKIRVYQWKESVSGSGTFSWIQKGVDIPNAGDGFYNYVDLSEDGSILFISDGKSNKVYKF